MLDAAVLTRWATAASAALELHCDEVDRINVFPVADRDTGTNLLLTMRAAVDAVGRLPDGEATASVAAAAAADALRATTAQLPELTRAGVVDAGGLGLFVVLDALDGLLNGHAPAAVLPAAVTARPAVTARGSDALTAEREAGSDAF